MTEEQKLAEFERTLVHLEERLARLEMIVERLAAAMGISVRG